MEGHDYKLLCKVLSECTTTAEVESILERHGLMDEMHWKYYGNVENNFSTIGNQQSSAELALCEKITNSIDAILIKECLARQVSPESEQAPATLRKAVEEFFQVPGGHILNIGGQTTREKLADMIYLCVTGSTRAPTITVVDQGEGQHPEKFEDTLLSLNRSNKLRIPFVQGKNNMGSTGVLEYCTNGLQLIISRRHPDIEAAGKWGLTIVRKFPPTGRMKHSTYKFLAPDGKIASFDATELHLYPGQKSDAAGSRWVPHHRPLQGGTYIKMFEYQLPSGIRSDARTQLHYKLASFLPDLGLPVSIIETRYKRRDAKAIIYGLHAKLRDESDSMESGFPTSFTLNVERQKMDGKIYLFRKGRKKEMYNKTAVIFSDNGQAQGFLTKRFFTRKAVSYSFIANDLIVIIDCTPFDQVGREALFMNSRDRLRDGEFKRKIEQELEKVLSESAELKRINNMRKQSEIEKAVEESSDLKESFLNLLKDNPELAQVLQAGHHIRSPIPPRDEPTPPALKEFPTFFELQGKRRKFTSKPGGTRKLKFNTDVQNDYFSRAKSPGRFTLHVISINGTSSPIEYPAQHSIALENGVATLGITMPNDVGTMGYRYSLTDVRNINGFSGEFEIEIREPQPSGTKGSDRKNINVPEIKRVSREEWKEHNFDDTSAATVTGSSKEGYIVYVNTDNAYLLKNMRKNPSQADSLVTMYCTTMVVIAMLLVKEESTSTKEGEFSYEDAYDLVRRTTRAITPGIFPLLMRGIE